MTRARIIAPAALALLLGAAALAHAQGYDYGPGMMRGWGWGLGMIGMLLWWLLVILGIVLLAKWIFGGSPTRRERTARDHALEILRERYARSEIGKEEFEQKRRDLGG